MRSQKTAETDAFKQIDEYIGSGHFMFKKDEWKRREKTGTSRIPNTSRGRSRVGPRRRKVVSSRKR